MSRDLTPYELYLFEKAAINNGGYSLWDFTENLTITYKGETVPYRSSVDKVVRKQYPQLGRLLNNFENAYESLLKIKNGLDVLERCDKELEEYLTLGSGDESSYVIKWFKGELDSAFYYSEENDRLFLECMCKEAMVKESSLDSKIQDAHERLSEKTSYENAYNIERL